MTRTYMYPNIQKSLKVSDNVAKMSKVSKKKSNDIGMLVESEDNFYTIQNAEELHPSDLENTAILDYNF